MKRRTFIQSICAALAVLPFARRVAKTQADDLYIPEGPVDYSAMKGLPYIVENSGIYHGIYQGPLYSERIRPTVKVTGVWKRTGFESSPYECEVNESAYIELPKIQLPLTFVGSQLYDVQPDVYRIYAPLHGFEKTGPWYFLRQVSYRDAKRARFTVVADYKDSDLVAERAPRETMRITFPTMAEDQDFWYLYGGGQLNEHHPIGIFGK